MVRLIFNTSFQFQLLFEINLRTEFSETIKEAKVQALGQAMKACEAAGTSFFGGKFETEMRVIG